MPVTPTGPAALPLARARELFAASTALQVWLGVDEEVDPAAAAAEHIYLVAKRPDTEAGETWSNLRPMLIIDYTEGSAWRRERDSEMGQVSTWRFRVTIEANVPAEYLDDADDADVALWFLNKIGAVLDNVWSLQGATNPDDASNTFIVLRETEMAGVMRANDNADPEFGDCVFVEIEMEAASI